MQTTTVRVLRAFFYNGKPAKAGETVEVPAVFAAELVSARKAERIEAAKPAPVIDTDKPKTDKGKGARDAQ